eukprot:scaffold1868_cov178-Amphora_coffeaeformis.AAC.5
MAKNKEQQQQQREFIRNNITMKYFAEISLPLLPMKFPLRVVALLPLFFLLVTVPRTSAFTVRSSNTAVITSPRYRGWGLDIVTRCGTTTTTTTTTTSSSSSSSSTSSSDSGEDLVGDPTLAQQLESLAKTTAHDDTAVATARALLEDYHQDEVDHTGMPFGLLDTAVGNAWLQVNVYAANNIDATTNLEHIHSIANRISEPTDETYGLVLEAHARAKDWTGAEQYWDSLHMNDSNMTTLLLHKRLRMLGGQGKATDAEALLREYVESTPSLVTQKAWVDVLRAYASLVGRRRRRQDKRRPSDPRHSSRIDEEDNNNKHNQKDVDDKYVAKIQSLMKEMTSKDEPPTTDAFNALLRALAQHSKLADKAQKAESVLFGLLEQSKTDRTLRPNADSFYYTLQASRGTPYPKVESLWQLQTALWRQTTGMKGEDAAPLIPTVRNLNAATAALAVSRLPNKAAKAQQWTTEWQALAQEVEQGSTSTTTTTTTHFKKMTLNVDSYKNILSAAAHTSRHAPLRERRQAWEIAMGLHKDLLLQPSTSLSLPSSSSSSVFISPRDASTMYKYLLQAVGHLLDTPTKRDALATELFEACCEAGVTTPAVVTAFERACASETTVLRILGGFAEDLLQLPVAWTSKVEG